MQKKKTENALATDPVSVLCQKTGMGRSIATEMIAREDREAKVVADKKAAAKKAKSEQEEETIPK